MNLNRVLVFTVSILALSGCASTPTHVNTGPIHARTFNFVIKPPTQMAYANNDAALHSMIQNAISSNLTSRGLTRVSSGGDITVPYLLVTGNNVSTTVINEYFGYSPDVAVLHDKAHDAYTGTQSRNYFEAGTLLIDITSGKSSKILYRGYTSRPLIKGSSPATQASRIQGAVDEILNKARLSP